MPGDLRTFSGGEKWENPLKCVSMRMIWMETLSCTFSILTPNSHEARQFAHSPTQPKSEAVAPRYSWETGTTAQSPSRCSDVLP